MLSISHQVSNKENDKQMASLIFFKYILFSWKIDLSKVHVEKFIIETTEKPIWDEVNNAKILIDLEK